MEYNQAHVLLEWPRMQFRSRSLLNLGPCRKNNFGSEELQITPRDERTYKILYGAVQGRGQPMPVEFLQMQEGHLHERGWVSESTIAQDIG